MPLSNTTLDTLASQPYWDDFDSTKGYHRVLIRPKMAVQTRELNQLQSILQNQIEQFGAGVFKQGAAVTGGRQTIITSAFALQLQRDEAVDIANFYDEATGVGYIVRGQSSGAEGQIIEIARQAGETNTAVIYTARNAKEFQSEEIIEFINPANDTVVVATLTAARSSVPTAPPIRRAIVFGTEAGTFFVAGHFVETTRQTTVLSSDGPNVSRRIGFDISEEIITETDDTSLYDPALGTTNYAAPGAHRLKISLNLVNKPIFATPVDVQSDEENFVELARVVNGALLEPTNRLEPTLLEQTLAERTYDESGDYVVDPFILIPTEHNPPKNVPNARGYLNILASSNVVVTGDLASSFTVDTDTDVTTAVLTVFTEDVGVGDTLIVENEERLVTAVLNNTVLQVNTNFNYDYTNTPFTVRSPNKMTLSFDPGRAYVRGYQIKTLSATHLAVDRPRTTKSIDNGTIQTTYGPYILVNRANNLFNLTTTPLVDLHCVPFSNINSAQYTATKMGIARLRAMVPDSTASAIGVGNANTLYQMYYIAPEFTKKTYSSTPISSVNATAGTLTLKSSVTNINATSQPQAFTGAVISAYSSVTGSLLRYLVQSTSSESGTHQPVLKLSPESFIDTINTSANVLVDFNETCIRGVSNSSAMLAGASVPVYGRVGQLANGITQIYGAGLAPELFRFREQWIQQGSLSDVSYDAFVPLTNISGTVSGGTTYYLLNISSITGASFAFSSSDPVYDNFIVANTLNAGVSLVGASVADVTSTTANLVINSATVGNVNIYVRARITPGNANRRNKTLITGNSNYANVQVSGGNIVTDLTRGHIAINTMNVSAPSVVSLGIPDVYRVQKVYVATGIGATNLTSVLDVTDKYNLDNGQRDWCYDHASLVLKPGYSHEDRNGAYKMVAIVDWFQHTPNTGVVTVDSYTNSGLANSYTDIPVYTSPSTGTKFALRDYVDFRPLRTANTTEANVAHNPYVAANTFFETQYHADPTGTFLADYEHYLGRMDKVVVNKKDGLQVITGAPSVSPTPPADIENALTLYVVKYPPYVANVDMVSYETFDYRRYTMRDIGKLEKRIERLEYYAQISLLEDKTFNTPELDVDDNERFKNGILVDPFISASVLDVTDPDISCSIDHSKGGLYPKHATYAFKLANAVSSTMVTHANRSLMMPYTHAPFITQSLASKHESVNPFNVSSWRGSLVLSPESDIWIETEQKPTVVQNLYGENDNWIEGDQPLGTAWGAWTTHWEGEPSVATQNFVVAQAPGAGAPPNAVLEFVDVTRTVTTRSGFNTRSGQKLTAKNSTIATNLGGRIVDSAVIPFMRRANIMLAASGLKPGVILKALFDDKDVTNYVERANEISFATAADASKFIPGQRIVARQTDLSGAVIGTAMVAGVSDKTIRVVDAEGKFYDGTSSTVVIDMVVPTALLDAGVIIPANTRRYATATGYKSYSGKIQTGNATGTTILKLDTGASSVANAYANADLCITVGSGAGQRLRISDYNEASKIVTLSTPLTALVTSNSRYSIGPLYTDGTLTEATPSESEYNENGVLASFFGSTPAARQPGSFYGMFRLPGYFRENSTSVIASSLSFPTGDRVLSLTDNTSASLSTTSAENRYRASGVLNYIQDTVVRTRTTQIVTEDVTEQSDPFSTESETVTFTPTGEYIDPLAQTFLIDPKVYPEGLFMSAVDLFFAKISEQGTKFTVQIRRVQDGNVTENVLASTFKIGKSNFNTVPLVNGEYVTPDPSNASHYTRFFFEEPVYLEPGFQYAIALLSNSSDYRVFVAEIDKQVIGSTQVISEQPYAGSLFYSQNGSTWTPVQKEDLMFVLHRAVFSTNAATPVLYLSETINTLSLGVQTDTAGNFDFDTMRVSAVIKEFNATKNNTSFVIRVANPSNSLLDSYEIPLQEDIILPTRARVRVNDATCVRFEPTVKTNSNAVTPIIFTDTVRLTGIRHIIDNGKLYANGFVILNPGAGFPNSCTFPIVVSSSTGSGAVLTATTDGYGKVTSVNLSASGSGYADTPTLTWTESHSTNAVIQYRGETSPACQITGEQKARYITRRVHLVEGFDAGDIKAYILANRPANTHIDLYYKVLSSADKGRFEDKNWTRMILRPDQETQYSKSYTEFREYEYRTANNSAAYTSDSVTYDRFNTFAIKIVMRTNDTTIIPRLDNLRAIALDT